jgi:hypothetical protein
VFALVRYLSSIAGTTCDMRGIPSSLLFKDDKAVNTSVNLVNKNQFTDLININKNLNI